MSRKITIDEIDVKILEQFQRDSNITNKDLAEIIGLSPPSTLVRVRNLIEKRFIKDSVVRMGWKKLGFDYEAAVFMSIHRNDKELVEALMSRMEGVIDLDRMHRDEKIPNKLVHYAVKCVFKTEEDFIDSWNRVFNKCAYRVDIEVLQFQEPIIKNKVVPIDRMNLK